MEREIKVCTDMDDLIYQAAERVTAAAERAIAARGAFSIALSGGKTPEGLYRMLAGDLYRPRIDWKKTSVYFGDERCVPPDSDQSNYRMASVALLSKVGVSPDNVHRMRGEIEPEAAAKEYGELLKAQFGDGGLDLILLGMGDDGHTASLFPGTAALAETRHRCAANFVPKLNAWRITMTAPFINRAEQVIALVAGKDKAARVAEVLEGPRDPQRLPIQLIEPAGKMTWLLDAAAAGMHDED